MAQHHTDRLAEHSPDSGCPAHTEDQSRRGGSQQMLIFTVAVASAKVESTAWWGLAGTLSLGVLCRGWWTNHGQMKWLFSPIKQSNLVSNTVRVRRTNDAKPFFNNSFKWKQYSQAGTCQVLLKVATWALCTASPHRATGSISKAL
jgi:hypothetical protein